MRAEGEATERPGRTEQQRRVGRWILFGSPVVLVVVYLAVVFFPLPRAELVVSEETTYLTGPLRADGTVDYAAALNARMSEGVTAENNAAVVLLRVMGPDPFGSARSYLDQLITRMGVVGTAIGEPRFIPLDDYLNSVPELPSISGPTSSYVSEQEARVRAMSEHIRGLASRPWGARDERYAAEWVGQNEEPLDLLVDITSEHRFYWPLIPDRGGWMISAILPHLYSIRQISEALNVRAMGSIGEGDLDRAWTDAAVLFRIGTLLDSETLLGGRFQANATLQRACDVGEEILRVDPDGALVQRMHDDLAGLRPLRPFEVVLETEYLSSIDVAVGDILYNKGFLADGAAPHLVDINMTLARMREWHVRHLAALRMSNPSERMDELRRLEAELGDAHGEIPSYLFPEANDELTGYVLWRMRTPAVEARERLIHWAGDYFAFNGSMSPVHAIRIDDFGRARFACFRAVVAIRLHKAREGRYPVGLDELTPGLLGEVPVDPFTGEALRYERQGAGYLLWSIGPDMRDSNGTAEFDSQTMNVNDHFDIMHKAER